MKRKILLKIILRKQPLRIGRFLQKQTKRCYMKYSDVKNAFGSDQDKALAHFVNYGMKEGRQGIKTFNVNVYLVLYPPSKFAII